MSTVSTAVAQRDRYLEFLLAQSAKSAQHSPLAIDTLRAMARAVAQERTFPSNRDEDWRFTDLSSLLTMEFQSAAAPSASVLSQVRERLTDISLEDSLRVVFVNGTFSPDLSSLGEGVSVLSQSARTWPLMKHGICYQ